MLVNAGREIRYRLEYLAAATLLSLVDRLPLERAYRHTVRLADAAYRLSAFRRRTARQNILLAGITADPREADRIARESFRHFGMVIMEFLKAPQLINEDNWTEWLSVEGPAETRELLAKPGAGVILATGHFGSWQTAGQLLSYLKPVTGISRKMDNPYTEALIARRKPFHRFQVTPKHDADRGRFLATLQDGNILAYMIDQHAGRRGITEDFFGHAASCHTAHAMLHLTTGAPIVFAYCLRTGPMHFKACLSAPIMHTSTGNKDADIRAIVRQLNRLLEDAIRQTPTQYLWGHRRWRKPPPPLPAKPTSKDMHA
jgi:KDO2-lipid IV(A) lauroyltransferase